MEGGRSKRISQGYIDNNNSVNNKNTNSYSKLDINGLESNRKQPSQKRKSEMPSTEFSSKDLLSQSDIIQNQANPRHMSTSYGADRLSKSLDQEDEPENFRGSMLENPRYPKLSILKGGRLPRNTMRQDRNGYSIDKDLKKQKISFADNININTNGSAKLADVYLVESYKKFNAENTHGQQQGCCVIF
ncbi:UNKNOWN [Stylonychia lemnae]|uniref:Uncharacterized protein n=1 Tax=Stylonychia lemnae TaxID=5949 RepID=A0A077ZSR3_STYLE|nr:UNKNOWN [Stylonychia lemnae]|eukprot:CDW72599.1 UNKNOWN [Stylonychia lemnae]